MEKLNWRRVLLGGALAGTVLIALTASTLFLSKQNELFTTLQSGTRGVAAILFVMFVFLFLGTLMTFWYAAIRPRFGPGPITAAIAGLAVWLIVVSQFLKSVAIYQPDSNLPSGPMQPILYLAIIVAGTEAGAWLYKEA